MREGHEVGSRVETNRIIQEPRSLELTLESLVAVITRCSQHQEGNWVVGGFETAHYRKLGQGGWQGNMVGTSEAVQKRLTALLGLLKP